MAFPISSSRLLNGILPTYQTHLHESLLVKTTFMNEAMTYIELFREAYPLQ